MTLPTPGWALWDQLRALENPRSPQPSSPTTHSTSREEDTATLILGELQLWRCLIPELHLRVGACSCSKARLSLCPAPAEWLNPVKSALWKPKTIKSEAGDEAVEDRQAQPVPTQPLCSSTLLSLTAHSEPTQPWHGEQPQPSQESSTDHPKSPSNTPGVQELSPHTVPPAPVPWLGVTQEIPNPLPSLLTLLCSVSSPKQGSKALFC